MVTWAILNIGLDILPWVTKRVVVKLVGPLLCHCHCCHNVFSGHERESGQWSQWSGLQTGDTKRIKQILDRWGCCDDMPITLQKHQNLTAPPEFRPHQSLYAKVPMVTKANRLRKRLSRRVRMARLIFLTERLLMIIEYWDRLHETSSNSVSLIFLDMYQWCSINMARLYTILLPPVINPLQQNVSRARSRARAGSIVRASEEW